jgi:predicted Zn-dependent protease
LQKAKELTSSFGQSFMSIEAGLALVAMWFFWVSISQPDDVLTLDKTNVSGQTQIVDSPDVLKLANEMEPNKLAQAGKFKEASEAAETLLKSKPHNVLYNLCAGNVYLITGASNEGLKLLKRSVALAPYSRFVRLNYAQQLTLQKHYDEAIAQYKLLSRAYPRWSEPYLELANIYLVRNNYVEAAQELQNVLLINPSMSSVRKTRGLTLAKANKTKEGLDEYMMGVTIETQSGLPETLKEIVASCGTVDRAIYSLQQQADQREDDYVPRLRLAQLYSYLGQSRDAKTLLLHARRIAPTNPEIHRTLAVVLKKLGDEHQAVSEFMLSMALEKQKEDKQMSSH